ncbi:MAG: DUF3810 domain-containing protein [Clostridia bacterium]
MKKFKKIIKIKRLYFLLLVPISLILIQICKSNSYFTEQYYSLTVYPVIAKIWGFVFSLVPFSVGEILLVGTVFFMPCYLIFSIVKTIKTKKIKTIKNFALNITAFASVVFFMYTIFCGLNYYRLGFEYYFGVDDTQYSVEELQEMCIYLITTGGEIRETLTDEDFDYTDYEMAEKTQDVFSKFSTDYKEIPSKIDSAPKPVILSELMSRIKITGVFFPFTIEANVNVDTVDYSVPYTMLHEQAHQWGFMFENEANFIAWLAGKTAEDDVIRYSAYMSATTYAMNSLYSADKELYYEAATYYSDLQWQDLYEKSAYWEPYNDTTASDTWTEVNDTYLKANGQEQGVISYGEVTELILSDYYKYK